MNWLQGFIIWDSLNRKEKHMPPTITKKDWKGYDEKTKERFRAAGIDLDESPPVVLPERPKYTLLATPTKRKREGDLTSYIAGSIIIGVGFVFHAIGTLTVALGAWIIKQGAYMRNR